MKKILMLVPCDIFPPVHGSSTAVYYTIRHALKDNLFDVLLSHLYSEGGEIDIIHPNVNIRYCQKTMFDRLGYKSLFFNPHYYKEAYRMIKKSDIDIIQCELLWTALAGIRLKKKVNKPLILVEENVEYLKFERFGKPRYFTYTLKKIEKKCCELADKVVAVSDIDKKYIEELFCIPEDKIQVIHHCVDPDTFKYSEEGRNVVRNRYNINNESIVLTFVGKLDYIPNTRAVKYIAEKIYPAINQIYKNTKFMIIGQNYEHLLSYKKENMIFTGFVTSRQDAFPNLSDHLSASDIAIVPLDSGSGTRLKILEAAACSRPIISTEIGAEGLNFIDNVEIIMSEDVDEKFVASIIRLIEDKELSRKIGENAREKIEKEYNWEKEVKKFEKIYNEIT